MAIRDRMDGAETARIMYGGLMPEVKKNNMDLWNRVSETDVEHTRKVEFGRKFTAIDAHYQVMMATKEFGVAGEGWGWHFSDPIFPSNGTVVIKCVLWWGNKDNTVEQFGQEKLASDKGTVDKDAFKKAATDGLTKCLSYLGFNADVFLGKFDDSKYVEGLVKKQKETSVEEKRKIAEEKAKEIEEDYRKCKNLDEMMEAQQKHTKFLTALSERYEDLFKKINSCAADVVAGFDKK